MQLAQTPPIRYASWVSNLIDVTSLLAFVYSHFYEMYFEYKQKILHDRPWISPWIKSMSNELDITIHVFALQLSGHCDVISNRLWRHQKDENQASETGGRCEKSVFFIVTYGFVMPCKK